ncbi:MAG: hypothetical protein AB1352_00485 [Patescibacteria group bacterium]
MQNSEVVQSLRNLRYHFGAQPGSLVLLREKILQEADSINSVRRIHISPTRQDVSVFWKSQVLVHFRIVPQVAAALALVVVIVGVGSAVALRAKPGSPFYKMRVALEDTSVALYPQHATRAALEIELFDKGVRELKEVSEDDISSPTVFAVLDTLDERLLKANERIRTYTQAQLDPRLFSTIISATNKAINAHTTLKSLQESAPIAMQSKFNKAIAASSRLKLTALQVLVTYTDRSNDANAQEVVAEKLLEEIAAVKTSVTSLKGVREPEGVTEEPEDNVKIIENAISGAEVALREGKLSIALDRILESAEILESASIGRVEGESIEIVGNLQSVTSTNESSTPLVVDNDNERLDSSGNSDTSAPASTVSLPTKTEENIEQTPKEPPEYPVGFDL